MSLSSSVFKASSVHGAYGINYYFLKNGEKPQRLQFEATITYCGQYMDEYAIYHISKEKFVVNRNESDEYLYDIAKKCAKAIYPITILIDKHGKLVFIRTNDIVKNWMEVRTELDKYYIGEVAEKYLNSIEEMIKNEEDMKRLVTNDLFFNQIFSIVNPKMKVESEFEKEIMLIPFSIPLKFSCIQRLNIDSNDDYAYETIRVTDQGKTKNVYKYGELYNELGLNPDRYNAPVSAEYELCYRISKSMQSIESIEGDFLIKVNDEMLSTTRIQIYKLDEKPIEFGKDLFFMEAEKKERQNKSSLSGRIKRFFNI